MGVSQKTKIKSKGKKTGMPKAKESRHVGDGGRGKKKVETLEKKEKKVKAPKNPQEDLGGQGRRNRKWGRKHGDAIE